MSDLQCPATLLFARAGDAEDHVNPVNHVLSDHRSALTEKGRAQVRHLVETVRTRRITEVYSSTMHQSVQSGELASSELGVRHIVTEGLQELSLGEVAAGSDLDPRAGDASDSWLGGDLAATLPGADDDHAVVRRFRQAIEEIADTHRGETVLVFTHGDVMSLALPQLALNVRNDFAAQRFLPNCVAVEVEVDADGWRIVSWPSE
ncbi:MAG: histidine phosphatase family protein [Actinomycetota bacterium]